MSDYTIKEVAKITGIKAHTLRIWEKRYSFLKPGRTSSNIRFYNDDDVELLIYISELKNKGMRISEIAELSLREIKAMVRGKKKNVQSDLSNNLFEAVQTFNFNAFEENFKLCRMGRGFQSCMLDVIYPLIDKLSILFLAGSVNDQQERFLYDCLIYCLQGTIFSIDYEEQPRKPRFLIHCTGDFQQKVYGLHLQYLVKRNNYGVLNLSSTKSIEGLKVVYEAYHPEYLFTILPKGKRPESIILFLKQYSEHFSNCTILILNIQTFQFINYNFNNIHFIRNMKEAHKFLEHLS